MSSVLKRMLAGLMIALLLPLAASAFGNDSGAPANKSAASETTASSAPEPAASPAPAAGLNPTVDPLLQLLVSKGILSSSEVNSLATAPANQMREQLLLLLKAKGVLTAED